MKGCQRKVNVNYQPCVEEAEVGMSWKFNMWQPAVANAKNTILYAIVGIVVAVLAWVAVDYVFNVLTG